MTTEYWFSLLIQMQIGLFCGAVKSTLTKVI